MSHTARDGRPPTALTVPNPCKQRVGGLIHLPPLAISGSLSRIARKNGLVGSHERTASREVTTRINRVGNLWPTRPLPCSQSTRIGLPGRFSNDLGTIARSRQQAIHASNYFSALDEDEAANTQGTAAGWSGVNAVAVAQRSGIVAVGGHLRTLVDKRKLRGIKARAVFERQMRKWRRSRCTAPHEARIGADPPG
jgi:hypothetical protein